MKASPRRDPNAWTGGSQGYKQWTEDEIADDNTGMEKDNTSQSAADTDKEERRRKKKEKKREKVANLLRESLSLASGIVQVPASIVSVFKMHEFKLPIAFTYENSQVANHYGDIIQMKE